MSAKRLVLLVSSIVFTTIFVGLNCSTAFAAPEVRVGFVDLQKALAASKQGVEAQKKYEAEVKKAQEMVDSKKAELEKTKDAYQKQAKSLSDKARGEKEEQILTMEKELKRSFQDSKEELGRKNAAIVNDLVKKIKSVVDDVGKSEQFTVILERSNQSVLYADSGIDITDKVVKKFDSMAN